MQNDADDDGGGGGGNNIKNNFQNCELVTVSRFVSNNDLKLF